MRVIICLVALLVAELASAGSYDSNSYNTLLMSSCRPNASPPVVVRSGYHIVGTSIGAAGYAEALAIHPTQQDYMVIGTDNCGVFWTDNAGESWSRQQRGVADLELNSFQHYISGAVGIENDEWSGFFICGHGGIWRRSLSDPTWEYLTDPADGYYYQDDGSEVAYSLPFSRIAWDGNKCLIAGSSYWRSEQSYEHNYYPVSYYGTPPLGEHYVWRYIFDDPSGAKWRPWLATESGSPIGACRDVDIEITAAGDTIAAFACRNGIFVWDGDSLEDLTDIPVHHMNGVTQYDYSFLVSDQDFHEFWDVELTKRGTLYLGVRIDAGNARPRAGIYKIHNIQDLGTDDDKEWWWVGDGTTFDHLGASIWDHSYGAAAVGDSTYTGTRNTKLYWIACAEGAGSAADTLLGAARHTKAGLFRAFAGHDSTKHCNEEWTRLGWYEADKLGIHWSWSEGMNSANLGWINRPNLDWGAQMLSVTLAPNSGRVLTQFNSRMHRGEAYGDSWVNVYCAQSPSDTNFFKSRGYDQNAVQLAGADILSDSTLVVATADAGVFYSDANWEYWDLRNPPAENRASYHTEGKVWGLEGAGLAVNPNYDGSGREAIAICYSDVVQQLNSGRLIVRWDEDDSGVIESDEVFEPTYDITNPTYYEWSGVCWVGDDIYVCGQEWSGAVNVNTQSVIKTCIFKCTDNGGADWTPVDWTATLNVEDAGVSKSQPNEILYSAVYDRVILVCGQGSNNAGGVYMKDPDSSAATDWDKLMGEGKTVSDRDILCAALSPSGATLYVGGKGPTANADGCIFKLQYLNNDQHVLAITQLWNNTSGDVYPTIEQNTMYASHSWNTYLTRAQRMGSVASIAVDETDTLKVWFGIEGSESQLMDYTGFFLADLSTSPPTFTDVAHFESGDNFTARSIVVDGLRVFAGTRGGSFMKLRSDGSEWR